MDIVEKTILTDNIRQIRQLNEWVDRNTVANAIKNRDVVFIYYVGDQTINRGYRTIEPYVLGTSKAGNLVVRAWQQNGATDTGNAPKRPNDEIPGFRLFRLDGITSMARTLKTFSTDPNYMRTNRPNYNPQDKQMTQIIAAVEVGNEQPQQQVSGNTSIEKPDTYKGMTNNTNWFKTQFDKFKNRPLFGGKPTNTNTNNQNDNVARSWFGMKKTNFENAIKKEQQNDNKNGI